MTADTTASPSGAEPRAFVLLKSRRRLDLLNPNPHAWTDDDLAAGLSRLTPSGAAIHAAIRCAHLRQPSLAGNSAPGLSKNGSASIDWMMSAQRPRRSFSPYFTMLESSRSPDRRPVAGAPLRSIPLSRPPSYRTVDPPAQVTEVMAEIAGNWPASRWEEFMQWNWQPADEEADRQSRVSPGLQNRLSNRASRGGSRGGRPDGGCHEIVSRFLGIGIGKLVHGNRRAAKFAT